MNPTRWLGAFALVALQSAPASVLAAQYYVSETGSSNNRGTRLDAPLKDLQAAIDQLRAGDQLTVLGTYRIVAPVRISKKATAEAPIVITGANTPAGEHRLTCAAPTDACLIVTDSSHVVLTGLVMDGEQAPSASLIRLARNTDVQLTNSSFAHAGVYSVYLQGTLSGNAPPYTYSDHTYLIDNNVFGKSKNTAIYLDKGQDLTVSRNNVDSVLAGDGIVVVNATDLKITDNVVTATNGFSYDNEGKKKGKEGIKVRPSIGVLIQNNRVTGATGSGIYLGAPYGTGDKLQRHSDIKVLDNTVNDVVTLNRGDGTPRCSGIEGWQAAMNLSRTDGVVAQRNHVYQNYGEGIAINDTTHATVQYNNSHDNFSVNYYLNNASYSLIDANQAINNPRYTAFLRCGAPAGGIGMANEKSSEEPNFKELVDLTISNNILVRGRFGINFYWEDSQYYHANSWLNNVSIVNNTIYRTWENAVVMKPKAGHINNRIESNLWVQGESTYPVADVPAAGFTCTANLWPTLPTSCRSDFDVIGSPLLVQAGGANDTDYQLRKNSPAIDAARYTGLMDKVWHDYFGNTRRQGRVWDIGAHER